MPHILDITGDDIASLTDADLRTLVARLALAELGAQGLPLSGVTAGGHQDAPDGGLDVRVDLGVVPPNPDFVPRALTGFQVKKPDMPVAAIEKEMRKNGKLRESIKALVAGKGAYIIVSAQGSVADKPLQDRRNAIRKGLRGETGADDVFTDFYDRERLATWTNLYPGISAWVRTRCARAIAGWAAPGNWVGTSVNEALPFLTDDTACIIDETSSPPKTVTLIDGIVRLRELLDTPRASVRLVGLSGVGKTRLVHALFEGAVGEDALDPSIAVYTDYGVEPATSARDMAQQLVSGSKRAILIVDNCNGVTHQTLTAICRAPESGVSLLTVEYDVRDDEPEETDVFRLQSASPSLVADWLEIAHPHVSQVNATAIAQFSGGNFRLAAALASTLRKGETLGRLKSQELFDRLFRQRQGEDKALRQDAEDLALLYSIDASSTADDSELAHIALLRTRTAVDLYGTLAELLMRGIVQSRGRWRAILPQAVANPLAASALSRVAPDALDALVAMLPQRMLRSFVHRLGFLHDSPEAKALFERWMSPEGRLGNFVALDPEGLHLLATLAPLAPERVLVRAESVLTQPVVDAIDGSHHRGAWVRLIHTLAFEESSFEVAATLLLRFFLAEKDTDRNHEAKNAFAQLFRVQASGTHATPLARRAFVRNLSKESAVERGLRVALDAMLDPDVRHHPTWPSFGARSRDWGWMPDSDAAYVEWFRDSIALAVELEAIPADGRGLLARHFSALWRIEPCRAFLEDAARRLADTGVWTDGWLAARRTLQFLRIHQRDEDPRLVALLASIAPTRLLDRATAFVIRGGGDFGDYGDDGVTDGEFEGWSRADVAALHVGRELAQDAQARAHFIPALVATTTGTRAFTCGRGLYEGSTGAPEIWAELLVAFGDLARGSRSADVLAGFMRIWHTMDPQPASAALDRLVSDPGLAPLLPSLERVLPLDKNGVVRLLAAIDNGFIVTNDLPPLAAGAVGATPPDALATLLRAVGGMHGGPGPALDILHSRLWSDERKGVTPDAVVADVGRFLLERFDFSGMDTMRDHNMKALVRMCCTGASGINVAKAACGRLRERIDTYELNAHDLTHTIPALFDAQPEVALDGFLLDVGLKRPPRFWHTDREFAESLDLVPPAALVDWAGKDPAVRFGLLSERMQLFVSRRAGDNNSPSGTFLNVLGHAPDKAAFLGNVYHRLGPAAADSYAAVIPRRVEQLRALSPQPDGLAEWLDDNSVGLAEWIETERSRTSEGEQAFE